jgi:hypothetical protein
MWIAVDGSKFRAARQGVIVRFAQRMKRARGCRDLSHRGGGGSFSGFEAPQTACRSNFCAREMDVFGS